MRNSLEPSQSCASVACRMHTNEGTHAQWTSMHGKMAPIRSSSFGIKLVFTWFCYAVMMYFAKIIWEISQLQMIRPIGRSYIVIPRTGTQFSRPFGQRTPSTETLLSGGVAQFSVLLLSYSIMLKMYSRCAPPPSLFMDIFFISFQHFNHYLALRPGA